MLSKDDCREIFAKAEKFSAADETEVLIEASRSALTRFANNTIHQNTAEEGLTISIRCVTDGRMARASTNKTDDESLRRAAEQALTMARQQPPNLDLLPMLGSQSQTAVERYDPATASLTPEDRARAAGKAIRTAREHEQTAAGVFANSCISHALLNSRGLFATHRQTHAEFSVTMLDRTSTGWSKASSPVVARIDVQALAERASDKAVRSAEPREIQPGDYTVILEPAAVLDLVGFLFYDFSATAVEDKRSCFSERMGNKLFADCITIWDDVYHPLQTGAPFDGEGLPRQRVLLVERGIPKNLVYSRQAARKQSARPTGHGLPLPNEWGEAPVNLVVDGGTNTLEEMVASTDRGILVTRLWYIREVDPYEKVLTGMTRDGTFLIENGRIIGGIRNFRFNQRVLEMLANVEMLGPAVRAAGEEAFDMVVPAMKVRNFHFTEVTKF
jgi:predicted Zn-dependent protease